ncbi:protein SSXA1-like [Talpa occidentalis]|uniref:protein SSXA1-like n=1 Tax=Talpa occidentalis TaxID=50954 RepID=UPI00188EDA56|nr:protein SSXA1-like [Talpa occidentalis]
MNISSSFVTSPKEQSQKLKKCEAFKDISKYFSKEEWEKLGYSEKTTYVYMKRNYETMTGLGLRAALPAFMCPKKRTKKFRDYDSYEDGNLGNQNEPPQDVFSVQQRKHRVMTKMPEEEEDDLKLVTPGSENKLKQLCHSGKAGSNKRKNDVWACRLRERKNQIVYEEISDPEEED